MYRARTMFFRKHNRRKRKMSTVTITGTVTDAAGATGSYSVVVTLDSFTLSAVVTPAVAPAGTTRNLTVTPSGGTAPFTFGTPVGTGLTFTPVAGSPGQWTFVY
jgi:hypothetical protein